MYIYTHTQKKRIRELKSKENVARSFAAWIDITRNNEKKSTKSHPKQ